jgi:hypothetical protein
MRALIASMSGIAVVGIIISISLKLAGRSR